MASDRQEQRDSLIELLNEEINLTEADHARNASSAWTATVFASAGLLAVGTQVPDVLFVRVLAVVVIAVVALAALMFIGMQFGKRWSCADTSDVLRSLRSRLRAEGIDVAEEDLAVPSGSVFPNLIVNRLKPDTEIARERSAAVRAALAHLIAPWRWSAIDPRARSEAACYVAVVVSAVISAVAAFS